MSLNIETGQENEVLRKKSEEVKKIDKKLIKFNQTSVINPGYIKTPHPWWVLYKKGIQIITYLKF